MIMQPNKNCPQTIGVSISGGLSSSTLKLFNIDLCYLLIFTMIVKKRIDLKSILFEMAVMPVIKVSMYRGSPFAQICGKLEICVK